VLLTEEIGQNPLFSPILSKKAANFDVFWHKIPIFPLFNSAEIA